MPNSRFRAARRGPARERGDARPNQHEKILPFAHGATHSIAEFRSLTLRPHLWLASVAIVVAALALPAQSAEKKTKKSEAPGASSRAAMAQLAEATDPS